MSEQPEHDLDATPWAVFAQGAVACPVCGGQVPVPVLARITGESDPHLDTRPDMTEMWAHSWTHREAPDAA